MCLFKLVIILNLFLFIVLSSYGIHFYNVDDRSDNDIIIIIYIWHDIGDCEHVNILQSILFHHIISSWRDK